MANAFATRIPVTSSAICPSALLRQQTPQKCENTSRRTTKSITLKSPQPTQAITNPCVVSPRLQPQQRPFQSVVCPRENHQRKVLHRKSIALCLQMLMIPPARKTGFPYSRRLLLRSPSLPFRTVYPQVHSFKSFLPPKANKGPT